MKPLAASSSSSGKPSHLAPTYHNGRKVPLPQGEGELWVPSYEPKAMIVSRQANSRGCGGCRYCCGGGGEETKSSESDKVERRSIFSQQQRQQRESERSVCVNGE
eukprot:scaffold3008_cov112-Skeletonema_menzelii.AAC.6